jgi:hypothetical protein
LILNIFLENFQSSSSYGTKEVTAAPHGSFMVAPEERAVDVKDNLSGLGFEDGNDCG